MTVGLGWFRSEPQKWGLNEMPLITLEFFVSSGTCANPCGTQSCSFMVPLVCPGHRPFSGVSFRDRFANLCPDVLAGVHRAESQALVPILLFLQIKKTETFRGKGAELSRK